MSKAPFICIELFLAAMWVPMAYAHYACENWLMVGLSLFVILVCLIFAWKIWRDE